MPINFPAFLPDSRGNSLEKHERLDDFGAQGNTCWVLCGPSEVVTCMNLVFGGDATWRSVPKEHRAFFSHCLELPQGEDDRAQSYFERLKTVLLLPSRTHLDVAIAQDWYKIPSQDVAPQHWPNTPIGEALHRSKYYKENNAARRAARATLRAMMVDSIKEDPLLASADTIVSVPGHDDTEMAFSEKLAKALAETLEKGLVITETSGSRMARKADQGQSLEGVFVMPEPLHGSVLIVDDVYRSGATMEAVASAARDSGAEHVFGLVPVRTMRG